MHVEWLSHWSGQLNREMPLNRYGHAGLPIVVFPSSGGTHNEYADFGMIDACRDSIEAGRVQFFTWLVWTVRVGWLTGNTLTIGLKCIGLMSVMSLAKLFLLLSIRRAGLIQ